MAGLRFISYPSDSRVVRDASGARRRGLTGRTGIRRSQKVLPGLMLAESSFPGNVPALLMSTATPNQTYIDKGAARALLPGRPVYIRIQIPAGPNEGVIYGSGVLLNKRWVLTAAHAVTPHLPFDPTYTVRLGTNLNADLGVALSVKKAIPHLDWTGPAQGPDVALLEVFPNPALENAFAGIAEFASADAVANSYASMAGYGRPALPRFFLTDAEHFKLREGLCRKVSGSIASFGLSDAIYSALDFSDGTPQSSRATGGDSGMPIYNSSGLILGIGMGSSGQPDSLPQSGFTFYTKTSAFLPWALSVMTPEPPKILNMAHSPTTATITVQADLVDVAYAKWVVEESPDMTTWSGGHAISNGVGLVPVSPGAAKRYYRLKFLFDTPPVTAGNP